jgi:hypothetical protein
MSNPYDSNSPRYLQLNEFETSENDTYQIETTTKVIETEEIPASNSNEHNFTIRFFYKPILCFHCRDYIWGAGYIGYGCKNCSKCVHFKCLIFVSKPTKINCCSKIDEQQIALSLDSFTKSNIYPIENWNNDLVKEWLAVVNLHRYAEVFSKYNITGSKLISLSSEQLYEYRIRDSFHHKAIIEACQELTFRSRQYSTYSQMLKETNEFRMNLNSMPYKANRHYFLVHTLSSQMSCHTCLRPLLGIIHQCYQCQQCGLMVHRQCSSTGLPDCKTKTNLISKHYLFGVSLFDLLNTSTQQQQQFVPDLLVKAFKYIEEKSLITGEDLYDAYRLSSDTTKIEPIKQQLNENGIDLIRFERYDLNTIAAIVKSFLRDLQDSVIPEEIYTRLIDNIQVISTNDLRELIQTSLHPQHLACLSYIMAHLIRVWQFQFKTRGCHYMPDKIFHIFRSILMRPPWESIVQIVYNIEKQTLVIQRLMLECDWGEELPEYKIRARPEQQPPPPLPHSNSFAHIFSKILPMSKSKSNDLINNNNNNNNNNLIDNQEWFWNNIVNRDNTALILKNCPDGSFIVRNSNDKSPSAPYTLCVMKGTFVKSIKIFNSNNLYDIEQPCRFESVQALVDYYSRVSLKEYNHNLDLKLTYGVSKFKFGKTSEWSIDKLYASFREALDKYESLTKSLQTLEFDISNIREDLSCKRMACEAFDKIIEMYEEQKVQAVSSLTNLQLKKSNAISTTTMLAVQFMPSSNKINNTNDSSSLQSEKLEKIILDNKLKLEKKILDLKGKKEQVENDIDYLNVNLSELQEKLDSIRPELIELRKKRENYHLWLLQRGENEDKIQTVIEPVRAQTNENNLISIHDNYDSISLITNTDNNRVIKTCVSMGDLNNVLNNNNSSLNNLVESLDTTTTTTAITNDSIIYSKTEDLSSLPYIMDSINWFRADFTREKAEEILKDKSNGTFLVRSSMYPGSKYVLSVVNENQPIHILIDELHNKYFLKSNNQRRIHNTLSQPMNLLQGMVSRSRSPSTSSVSGKRVGSMIKSASNSSSLSNDENEKDSKFETLTDLIIFYSKNELKVKNQSWNMILSYPAFYYANLK